MKIISVIGDPTYFNRCFMTPKFPLKLNLVHNFQYFTNIVVPQHRRNQSFCLLYCKAQLTNLPPRPSITSQDLISQRPYLLNINASLTMLCNTSPS